MQLSWDLHLHPGPREEARWGNGFRVWEAASAAGVAGFVWKDHGRHIEADAAELPPHGARCIPSLVLNHWASVEDVSESLAAGVRWFWGPTRDTEGKLQWDLALPAWWPEAEELFTRSLVTIVLSTGHLGEDGRRRLAEMAAGADNLLCSVTHSLYVAEDELGELMSLGCVLEHDLFTASFPIPGRPERDLAVALARALDHGGVAYLTSDAGQDGVGNPFLFAEKALEALSRAASEAVVGQAASVGPARVAAHLGEMGAAA
jgi:hypothetical protein